MKIKSFKQFIEEDVEEKPKIKIPEFFVHYANLTRMIDDSRSIEDRTVIANLIKYCMKEFPREIYDDLAYRGTYLSDEKLLSFFLNGKMTLDLMPYYSFTQNPTEARDFQKGKKSKRNSVLVSKQNVKGIYSLGCVEALFSKMSDFIDEEYDKDLEILFDRGDMDGLKSLFKEIFIDDSDVTRFFDKIVFPFYSDYYEQEEEILVLGPIEVLEDDVSNVTFANQTIPISFSDGIRKNYKKILKIFREKDYEKIIKEIEELENLEYFMTLTVPNGLNESYPKELLPIKPALIGFSFSKKGRKFPIILWIPEGNKYNKYEWKNTGKEK